MISIYGDKTLRANRCRHYARMHFESGNIIHCTYCLILAEAIKSGDW